MLRKRRCKDKNMFFTTTGLHDEGNFSGSSTISLRAKAKINLSLDITAKRPDGYHNIRTIMQTIDLHDNIVIDVVNEGIVLECNSPELPCDNKNIAYRAAELFLDKYGVKHGVKIKIDKNIPIAAGLAGGSSDAAAVLIGMNNIFNCETDVSKLMSIGKLLGADIPYCMKGGTVLAEGIGEILTDLKEMPKAYLVLAVPRLAVSTKWVYENFDINKVNKRPDINLIVSAINKGNLRLVADNMENVLETVTARKFSVINTLKQELKRLGALGSLMSGSGPSVFGIFEDKNTAQKAYEKIKCNECDLFLTEIT